MKEFAKTWLTCSSMMEMTGDHLTILCNHTGTKPCKDKLEMCIALESKLGFGKPDAVAALAKRGVGVIAKPVTNTDLIVKLVGMGVKTDLGGKLIGAKTTKAKLLEALEAAEAKATAVGYLAHLSDFCI